MPSGQPMAGAMFTVGINDGLGAGNTGVGPVPADTGKVAVSAQAIEAVKAHPATTTPAHVAHG